MVVEKSKRINGERNWLHPDKQTNTNSHQRPTMDVTAA